MEPREEKGKKLERESEEEEEEEGEIVMDTPEKGRISTSLSKFEDSPVFNYIGNLSPLETRRPLSISQSFNSYGFSSVPSIFTSPHVSSLKETKLLRRHSVCGSTNQEFSSENENKIYSNVGTLDISHKTEVGKEGFDPGGYKDDILNEKKVENEVSQTLAISHSIDPKCVPFGDSSSSLVSFCQEGQTSDCVSNGEQIREDGSFDWVNISDAADFLIFESPDTANFKISFAEPRDSEMRLDISEETQADVSVGVKNNESANNLRTNEYHLNAIEATGDALSLTCPNNQATCPNNQVKDILNEVKVNESACNVPRGVRRRCLVFDGGVRKKFLNDGSVSSSFTLTKCHVTSIENQLSISKPDNNSSRCIVPGIGLHLNALARSSNNYTANNNENVTTQSQLINDHSSNGAATSFANNIENLNQSMVLNSVDGDVGTEDAYQLSGYFSSHDLNPGSPKNKKRKLESGGEAESCKRCNCKKSKCLKLYCECFAAGVYCVEPCSCQDCFNKPIHEDTVLATRKQIESRNPLAFAPKVIRTTEIVPETTDDSSSTPASARHKRGCNCKKSGCLKKYCECYQGGVGCSMNCRCEACKNVFGRKEGSHIIHAEAESEEREMHQKSVADRNLMKHIIENNTVASDPTLPETPVHCGRVPIQQTYSYKNTLPRSVLSMASSSSTLYDGQNFGVSVSSPPQTKFEEKVLLNSENEEIPEILRSPVGGIQSSSPNSKRVSPPHHNFGSASSPAPLSSRKLILRSIPSFPSLKD